MLLRLRELQTKLEIELDEILQFPHIVGENIQLEALGEVVAHAGATFNQGKIEVRGTVDGDITYRCSRCLSLSPTHLHSQFTEWFTTNPAKADDDIHLVSGDEIELQPFVEETLVLGLEYRPLCQKNCKGLCPTCGANWNETSCKCDNRTINPRLSALKDLLSDDETE